MPFRLICAFHLANATLRVRHTIAHPKMVLPEVVNSSWASHLATPASPSSSLSSLEHHESAGSEPHDLLHACGNIMLQGLAEQFAWMFYYITPNSSLFLDVDQVPNYEVQVSGHSLLPNWDSPSLTSPHPLGISRFSPSSAFSCSSSRSFVSARRSDSLD